MERPEGHRTVNRIEARIIKLEFDRRSGSRWWEGRPLEFWPDHALTALADEGGGWPRGYSPSEDVLRAAFSGAYKDASPPGDGDAGDPGETP
jgi:hypothetical protein